jgi:hypothetical protein
MADELNTREEFTVTGPDGVSETVQLPAGLADELTDPGESPATVAADLLVQAFAQQTHAFVHHGGGGGDHLAALDAQMAEVFEERFGVSLEEALDHDH